MGQKRILACSYVPKRSKFCQWTAELWPFSTWQIVWFHWEPQGTKEDPLALIHTKNIQNMSTFGWVMAIFPLRGCVIPLRTTWDIGGSLGVDMYQKDKKSVKKWLSYGYFPPERLWNSIGNQMGQKGILGRSFVPKKIQNLSRNGWVMAFLAEASKD